VTEAGSAAAPRSVTPSRLRGLTILALLIGDAAALLAWSQTWFVLRVEGHAVAVPGSVAGGGVLAFALTGLALVLAVLLAGVVFRVVLGALQVLVGAGLAAAAAIALGDPVAASGALVADATGLTGPAARALITAVAPTAWPAVAIAAGAWLVLAGLLLAVGAARWPRATSRFERNRTVAADAASADTIGEWDALSKGDDPTDRAD
jgi:uncharacterized membrane protein (TIGR02234 family)